MSLSRICPIYAAKPPVLSPLLTSGAGNSAWGIQLEHFLFIHPCQTNSVLAKLYKSPFHCSHCVRTSTSSLHAHARKQTPAFSYTAVHSERSLILHRLQNSAQLSGRCPWVGSIEQTGDKEK